MKEYRRRRCRCEYNIKIALKVIGVDVMSRIELSHDREH
jgi:hypothetical protein